MVGEGNLKMKIFCLSEKQRVTKNSRFPFRFLKLNTVYSRNRLTAKDVFFSGGKIDNFSFKFQIARKNQAFHIGSLER